jgi:pimeloyl-ACP methyl ester carboxylesterase
MFHHDETPPLLLIHGSLSSSRMWSPIRDTLGTSRPVSSPDLLGYGANPPWEPFAPFSIEDEIAPLLRSLGRPADVVAHSYGAAVALRLLVEAPHLVSRLVLVEPAAFFLLRDLGPPAAEDRREIGEVAAFIAGALRAGAPAAAAARFVDYWNGAGAFAAMPESRRSALAARMGKVAADFSGLADFPVGLAALARLDVPVLIVTGDRGPGGPRRIGAAIARAMPRASLHPIAGAGHMLPMTHGEALAGIVARWSGHGPPSSVRRAA